MIPLVLEAAAGRRPEITVYGEHHGTPDGTCVRDYIHVADLARAHLLALDAMAAGAGSTAYNLGNGRGFSVREVVAAAQAVTQRTIAVRIGAPRAGDAPVLVADARKIRLELGWEPRHTLLADIIGSAWQWCQRQPGLA